MYSLYKSSKYLLHLAWLDHCPNTVVEAISQGCPVICTDSGGTADLVGTNGIVIPESRAYNFELTDYDNPYELDLDYLRSVDWTREIVVDNSYLDIGDVAKKYERVFLETIEREN